MNKPSSPVPEKCRKKFVIWIEIYNSLKKKKEKKEECPNTYGRRLLNIILIF